MEASSRQEGASAASAFARNRPDHLQIPPFDAFALGQKPLRTGSRWSSTRGVHSALRTFAAAARSCGAAAVAASTTASSESRFVRPRITRAANALLHSLVVGAPAARRPCCSDRSRRQDVTVDRRSGHRRRRHRLVESHCWSAWSTLWSTRVTNSHPRMTHSQLSHKKSPAKARLFGMEPTGFEPVTSCLQSSRRLRNWRSSWPSKGAQGQ
jgi:hypothetical protein